MKTVWVYINTAREVGDVDHLKVLLRQKRPMDVFAEHDAESMAFE
jgi:hypothetical protein